MSKKSKEFENKFLAELKAAVKDSDPEKLKKKLEEADKLYDNFSYESCNSLRLLKNRSLKRFVDEMPLGEFLSFSSSLDFLKYDIYPALEKKSDRFTTADIMQITESLGFPDESDAENLLKKLTSDPNPVVSEWLKAFILERSKKEVEEGASHSSHMKTMSQFRMIRWSAGDRELTVAIRTLVPRAEFNARKSAVELLQKLPWGDDRAATEDLIRSMTENICPEYRAAIKDTINTRTKPDILRLYLLNSLSTFEFANSIGFAIKDLAAVDSSEGRIAYMDWLWAKLSVEDAADLPGDVKRKINSALSRIDTSGWKRVEKGNLGFIINNTEFPGGNSSKVCSGWDSFLVYMVLSFETFRFDHMGCVIPFAICCLLSYGSIFLANKFWTYPPEHLVIIDDVVIFFWFAVLLRTTTTHFSGHETLKSKLILSFFFWGSFLLVPITIVAIRLMS